MILSAYKLAIKGGSKDGAVTFLVGQHIICTAISSGKRLRPGRHRIISEHSGKVEGDEQARHQCTQFFLLVYDGLR